MRIERSKWAGGLLLSLVFAPTAAADLFTYTGGSQTFTAPVDGVYEMTADGASGGNVLFGPTGGQKGGLGAEIGGTFTLTAGEILSIYVGGVGADANLSGAGGGGGSFVVAPGNIPLIVAGGGGGAAYFDGSGGGGRTNAANSHGGSAGDGGGGGGFTTAGGDGDGDGGSGFSDLSGGQGFSGGGTGGFGGGGGGGGFGGGGGGGYSGGAGGAFDTGGSGGGSLDAGLTQALTASANSGNGKVDIELVQAAVPEPTSCLLFGTLLVGIGAGLRKRARPAR